MTVKSSEEPVSQEENPSVSIDSSKMARIDHAANTSVGAPVGKPDFLQPRKGTSRPQRVLSQGPGYVAATFEGKAAQMEEGRDPVDSYIAKGKQAVLTFAVSAAF